MHTATPKTTLQAVQNTLSAALCQAQRQLDTLVTTSDREALTAARLSSLLTTIGIKMEGQS
ncbi:MAG: hypothetical protein HN344_03335 [Gammaproteobacteria bacterium]|jgi:hypothetical protein|nr:hypothetical protein [Gammaproteobacteria bacterium]